VGPRITEGDGKAKRGAGPVRLKALLGLRTVLRAFLRRSIPLDKNRAAERQRLAAMPEKEFHSKVAKAKKKQRSALDGTAKIERAELQQVERQWKERAENVIVRGALQCRASEAEVRTWMPAGPKHWKLPPPARGRASWQFC
jgi:hypothetical protein